MFKGNLILIEHNNELAKLIERVLNSDQIGKQSRRAHTIDHAFSLVAEMIPDVIIMDTVLPNMRISETISTILALAPQSELVLLTDYDDPRYHKAALANGARACLKKTLIGSDLVPLLKQIAETTNYVRYVADSAESRLTQSRQNQIAYASRPLA